MNIEPKKTKSPDKRGFLDINQLEYEAIYLRIGCNTSILPSMASVIFRPSILAIIG